MNWGAFLVLVAFWNVFQQNVGKNVGIDSVWFLLTMFVASIERILSNESKI